MNTRGTRNEGPGDETKGAVSVFGVTNPRETPNEISGTENGGAVSWTELLGSLANALLEALEEERQGRWDGMGCMKDPSRKNVACSEV